MILIDSAALAAKLREDVADMLALAPAVRRAAEHEAEDAACIYALTRTAYRQLRTAENLAAYTQLCEEPPQPRGFCASAVASSYWNAAQALFPSATLRTSVEPCPLWTRGNARLFTVCIGNLLHNALVYSDEQPAVTLQIAKRGNGVVFTVRDCGKGILPDTLAQVFAPWISVDPYGDAAPAPGLGLGLAIVQKYAAVYGGRLAAESTFGLGSSISLALPCCTPCDDALPAPDFLNDRCGTLYTQLGGMSGVCAY